MSYEVATTAEHDPLMPCRWCTTPTLRSTLNTFGARCAPCYRAFCRAEQPCPPQPDIGAKDLDPKVWAKTLKHRQHLGERLTNAQREMWREALKHQETEA